MYGSISEDESNSVTIEANPASAGLKLNRIIRNVDDKNKPMYDIICNYDFDGTNCSINKHNKTI